MPFRTALLLSLAVLICGCAASWPDSVSLECDTFESPSGFVLVTSLSSDRPPFPGEVAPEVTGYFVEERTTCTRGENRIGPSEGARAEIRGLSGRRPLRVERSGFFHVTGAALADTLVFEAYSRDWSVGYAITVEEAVESYLRDQGARRAR